jgi:DUF1680 family protein
MLKLTRALFTWTADPRYFDYYERVLFNHRLGTIDLHSGLTQYYLGVVPGSWRTFAAEHDSFWCCTGTGVEDFAKLNDSIYFHDAHALYVNLFTPSEVEWKAKKVRLRQTNTFPHSRETDLLIKADSPVSFALNMRVPAWVAAFPRLQVNGRAVDVSASPGSYLTIARTWQDGDTITLQLPMDLHIESMPDDRNLKAILYGPLVLAGELSDSELDANLVTNQMGPDLRKHTPNTIPSFSATNADANQWIQPAEKPLEFRTAGQRHDVLLKPFYQVPAGKPYSIYWNVKS